MITYTACDVWPHIGAPDVRSIAVGLGRIPRFAGQTRHFYPVLAHVQVVAAILPPPLRVHGLLHDAAESCLGDVPTTWKTDDRQHTEEVLTTRIYRSLGLLEPEGFSETLLKQADAAALAAEAHVCGHAAAEAYWPREKWTHQTDQAAALTEVQLALCQCYLDADYAQRVYGQALDAALVAHKAAA